MLRQVADFTESATGCKYSPVRHLASAIFPFSDRHKYMLMLTGYFDETGHSKDPTQRIVGMGGLLAPASKWETFESKWKRALREFDIPYFHMKEFAHSTDVFEDWKGREIIRRKLFGKLIKAMESAYPIPVGATVPKDIYAATYNQYPGFPKDEPYRHTLDLCVAGVIGLRGAMGSLDESEKVAVVFSQHQEFRNHVLRYYEKITKELDPFRIISPVSFADMRDLVPLQAADIVAYELKKEHERRLYEPQKAPRYGFQMLMKMTARHRTLTIPMFYFLDKDLLSFGMKIVSDAVARETN
jgi:Protein of unknown function (DUF3800)